LAKYSTLAESAKMKSFDEFELLLIHEGYDIPIGWANNYLVPEFQKAFTHFFKSLG